MFPPPPSSHLVLIHINLHKLLEDRERERERESGVKEKKALCHAQIFCFAKFNEQ